MRIAVIGAGGVGGYFGQQLVGRGVDVTFIARGAHLRALRETGLTIASAGTETVTPVAATDNPAAVGPVDVVILGVKAWQVPEASELARPLIGPDTFVLPLQNGVEAADQAAAVVGRSHVVGGLCHVVAFLDGPGRIRHEAGPAPTLTFGELDNAPSARVRAFSDACAGTGFLATVAPDIHAALWAKFLFITSFAGTGAVTRMPVGDIMTTAETRAMLEQAMQEVAAVAAARGVRLDANTIAESIERLDTLPASATASMQRDIMDGRPSELEFLNGAVVRLGRDAGVNTPIHRFMYASLLPTERHARRAG